MDMNSIFKKSAIGLAILGLSLSAYAGTITGAFVGVEGLDLQPRNGDLDFVTVFPETIGWYQNVHINPGYTWGWRLFAGLKFCGDEDLTLSWTRFDSKDHEDLFTSDASVVRFLDEDAWTSIFSEVDFKFDDVYGVIGHTSHLGPWTLRTAYGVEWLRIDSTFDVSATALAVNDAIQPPPITFADYRNRSDLHGFGPRFEFDMAYNMPYGLYAFARSHLSLLISNRAVDLFDLAENFDNFDFEKRRVVIPAAGIRLGLGYSFRMGDVGGEGMSCDMTSITLEAGWQVESYIHAIERPEGFNNLSTGAGIVPSNYTTKVSNFGNEGLFVGVKLSTGWFS